MLYRLLGKFFFLFYVIPAIVRAAKFAAPTAALIATKAIDRIILEEVKKAKRDARNTPQPYREYLDSLKD